MYFIARNNKFYNYIAHTSVLHRYLATFGMVCAFFIGGMYVMYYPLVAYNAVYAVERIDLQKKYDELMQMNKSGQELTVLIELGKKNIAEHALSDDKRQEHCQKRMEFFLDTIAQLGLKLNTYGSCKEHDKKWYTKDSAHCDFVGSLEKIMTFLETIKNSRKMITVTHATLTRIDDTTFQMSCDLGLITIKK